MNHLTTLAALTSVLILSVPASSEACWDGVLVTTGRVTLATSEFGDQWSPSFARQAALWTARIEAVLPDDVNLTVDHGWIEAWGTGGNETWGRREAPIRWSERDLRALFDIVTDLVQTDPQARSSALRVRRSPVTIQLAATHSPAFARRLAGLAQNHLRDDQIDPSGFIVFGGFPAWNDSVYITSSTTRNGERIYQVVLGAFVDGETARLALAQARLATGLQGFLRPL